MRLNSCFFAGVPTQTDWSQSYIHQSEDAIFGIVVHIGAPVSPAADKGKRILSNAMEAAPGLTKNQFLTLFKPFSEAGVNLAAILIEGSETTLYAQGEVQISLNRNGKHQVILMGSSQGQFVGGESRPGDYYTVSTRDFDSLFAAVDPERTPQDACDLSVANLHKVPDSSRVSAVFVRVEGEGQKTKVVAPVPSREIQTPASPKPIFAPRAHFSTPNPKLVRGIVFIGGAVILLLGLSWFLTGKKAKDLAQSIAPYQIRYSNLLALPSDKRLNELQGLRDLIRDLTDRANQTKEASLKRSYEQLLAKVQQSFSDLSGEKHYEKLDVFYDFRLIASDFISTAVAFDGPGKLGVFLDGTHSRLLSLSLEKKEALTLTVDEKLPNPFALAVINRKAYVLGNAGIMELSLPLNKLGSIVSQKSDAWVTPKLIDAFGTNAYIFDAGARNILKVDLTDPTASPSSWLRNKEGIDFASVVSMRVDGGMWLGDSTGKILRFMQGTPSSFRYTGVLDVPNSSVYLYTTQESNNLYVLEPRAKRILILGKDGSYQRAIISDDLSTATGLIVDETGGKIYVLSGSLVYDVPLQ